MAYFFRLILKRVIQILIGFVIGFIFVQFNSAHADYTPAVIYKAKSPFIGEWSTMQAACDATAPQHAASLNRTFVNVTFCQMSSINGLVSYNFTTSNYSNQQVNADTFLKTQTCGQGQNIVSGSAANGNLVCSGNPPPPTCIPPQVLNQAQTACENPPNPCENKTLSSTTARSVNSVNGSAPASVCISGCTYNVNFKNIVICAGSICSLSVVSPSTGATCNASPAPSTGETDIPAEKTPEEKCIDSGQSYGTINGTIVCAKAGTPTTPPLNVTDAKTSTNSAGVSTSTTTTTINNNTVTSTTTTTPAGGGTPTTETTEQDLSSFCEDNPTSKICKDDEKSTFAGSCTSSFTCDGDAISCATAKAVNEQKCDLEKAVTDSKTELQNTAAKPLGDLLNNGQYSSDVQQFIDGNGNSNTVINIPSSLSESGNANYTGSEIQDVSFTVQGQQVNVPLSNANEYFYIFGYILLALAYLSAYKIVTGAI